jgi:hypothetical protein
MGICVALLKIAYDSLSGFRIFRKSDIAAWDFNIAPVHVPPRMYSHALQSIVAFLDGDLNWSSRVQSSLMHRREKEPAVTIPCRIFYLLSISTW